MVAQGELDLEKSEVDPHRPTPIGSPPHPRLVPVDAYDACRANGLLSCPGRLYANIVPIPFPIKVVKIIAKTVVVLVVTVFVVVTARLVPVRG